MSESTQVSTKKSRKSSAISSAVWSLATSAFFVIGFVFDGWGYAWLCFLVAGALESILENCS